MEELCDCFQVRVGAVCDCFQVWVEVIYDCYLSQGVAMVEVSIDCCFF